MFKYNWNPPEAYEALEDGKVWKYGTPMQGELYFRKVSDVGSHAFESTHPDSATTVYDCNTGDMVAFAILNHPDIQVEVVDFEDSPFTEDRPYTQQTRVDTVTPDEALESLVDDWERDVSLCDCNIAETHREELAQVIENVNAGDKQ